MLKLKNPKAHLSTEAPWVGAESGGHLNAVLRPDATDGAGSSVSATFICAVCPAGLMQRASWDLGDDAAAQRAALPTLPEQSVQ